MSRTSFDKHVIQNFIIPGSYIMHFCIGCFESWTSTLSDGQRMVFLHQVRKFNLPLKMMVELYPPPPSPHGRLQPLSLTRTGCSGLYAQLRRWLAAGPIDSNCSRPLSFLTQTLWASPFHQEASVWTRTTCQQFLLLFCCQQTLSNKQTQQTLSLICHSFYLFLFTPPSLAQLCASCGHTSCRSAFLMFHISFNV